MDERFAYAFEELSEDLPRPPLAALRALFSNGIVLSPEAWRLLPPESRKALAVEGTRDTPSRATVHALLRGAPLRNMKMIQPSRDPDPRAPPAGLAKALGPREAVTTEAWARLRPVDRYVLATLAANTRLLARAVAEVLHGGKPSSEPWRGVVGHAEVHASSGAIERLASPDFLDGRGVVLARASGLRAARRVPETFDLRSASDVGVVELDCVANDREGFVLWQAHASTWDGAFSPTSSLVAATTAALALADMLRDVDAQVSVTTCVVQEESWRVGSAMFEDDATVLR